MLARIFIQIHTFQGENFTNLKNPFSVKYSLIYFSVQKDASLTEKSLKTAMSELWPKTI